ncbi:MAG: TIM barrel protein, partial [Bryobacteraceae bacterium]|nr:TIM barrel protein [Bryobacteraceae bacterium]
MESMTRRQMLMATAAAPAWLASRPASAQTTPLRNMGISPTAVSLRNGAARKANKPFDLVDHAHSLGLGGVETRLASTDAQAVRSFRQKLDSYNMRAVLNLPLPKTSGDVAAFDSAVQAAKEAGAMALHAAMTGRRYEQFPTLESFRSDFEQCQKTIALSEPVLRKHKMKIAIENHKGWRSAEQAAWMKRVSSEWVGVTFDFGNNVSLCEEPMESLRALAPWTIFSHIKEMAVQEYEEGFLLSEVPFGEGFYDTGEIVSILQKKDPDMLFCLEMITRDPLKIPVYTEAYWKTFEAAESPLPGR